MSSILDTLSQDHLVCHTVSSFHPILHFDFSVRAAQIGKYNQGKIGCGGKKGKRGRRQTNGTERGLERRRGVFL